MNARATNTPSQRLSMTIVDSLRDSRFATPDILAYSCAYADDSDPAQLPGDL
jgi:hypothetical protein